MKSKQEMPESILNGLEQMELYPSKGFTHSPLRDGEYRELHPLADPGEMLADHELIPAPSITDPAHQKAVDDPSQPAGDPPQQSGDAAPKKLSLAELAHKYPTYFKLSGPKSIASVSLTFDDAPDDHFTTQVLDILEEYGVKATFFVVGNRAIKHPEVIQRMIRDGHVIGSHSYNHPDALKLKDAAFREQITKTESIIKALTGKSMALYRPPYGNVSEEQLNWLASQKIHVVNWNVDSLDWKEIDADQIMANVFKDVGKGSIILQHSAGGEGADLSGTVQALPRIIERLQADGLSIVPLSELLSIPSYKE